MDKEAIGPQNVEPISPLLEKQVGQQPLSAPDQSRKDVQEFWVDLPDGKKVFLDNPDQVTILNSIIASGKQGTSTTELAMPYMHEGLILPSAKAKVRRNLRSIKERLERNSTSTIVNLTPRTRNIEGKEAIYVVKLKKNLIGVSEIKPEDPVDSPQSPPVKNDLYVADVESKEQDNLTFTVDGKTVVVPRKELYGIEDIALATGLEDNQTTHTQVSTVRKNDRSIQAQVLQVGRYRKMFFTEENFVKVVLAILENRASDRSKVVRSALQKRKEEGFVTVTFPEGTEIGGLTREEKSILELFIRMEGKTASKEQIKQAWIDTEGNPNIGDRQVSTAIRELRDKLQEIDHTIKSTKDGYFLKKGVEDEGLLKFQKNANIP